MPYPWTEWRWQAEKQRQVGGVRRSISLLISRFSHGPKVTSAFCWWVSQWLSSQALCCLGYLEVSLCLLRSRDFFQRHELLEWSRRGLRTTCCRAGGGMKGKGWMKETLWRCTQWDWIVRMWWLVDAQREAEMMDNLTGSLAQRKGH